MNAKQKMARIAIVVAMAVSGGLMAAPAIAASNKGISGTVYSGGAWFVSTTDRYKEGAGSVTVSFSQLPKAGISFGMQGASNQQIGSNQHWDKNETNVTRTLATNVSNGTKFFNKFKQYNACTGCSPYNFTGTQYY